MKIIIVNEDYGVKYTYDRVPADITKALKILIESLSDGVLIDYKEEEIK